MHCRLLAHLENVGELFKEALKIADLSRLRGTAPKEKLNGCAALLRISRRSSYVAIRLSTELTRQKSGHALKAPEIEINRTGLG
jgi:hypothetical protein